MNDLDILKILLQKSRVCKDNDCGNHVSNDSESFCNRHVCGHTPRVAKDGSKNLPDGIKNLPDGRCHDRVKTGTIYCEKHEEEYYREIKSDI